MIKVNTEALNKIKAEISALKGNDIQLCINRGRKRFDTVKGVINNTYPSVFTFMTNEKVQTFSYFDVLCGIVKIM